MNLNRLILLVCALLLSVHVQSQAQAIYPATPAKERLEGIARRTRLTDESLLKPALRNIGPTIMSGRAVDLEVNPEDPNEFYVAYASGGLWHTSNNGQSFEPLFDQEDVMTIGDFAVDWKTRHIWLGTGEVNSSRSSYSGVGMFSAPTAARPGSSVVCRNRTTSARSCYIRTIRRPSGLLHWVICILPMRNEVFIRPPMAGRIGSACSRG